MDCYRTFDGVKWPNYCDVLDQSHEEDVEKAKKEGKRIKLRKHPDGYYQAFIHPDDLK
jgi:quinolinate synthase